MSVFKHSRCSVPKTIHNVMQTPYKILMQFSDNPIRICLITDNLLYSFLNYRIVNLVFFIINKIFFLHLLRYLIQTAHELRIEKISYSIKICSCCHNYSLLLTGLNLFKTEKGTLLSPFVCNNLGRLNIVFDFTYKFLIIAVLRYCNMNIESFYTAWAKTGCTASICHSMAILILSYKGSSGFNKKLRDTIILIIRCPDRITVNSQTMNTFTRSIHYDNNISRFWINHINFTCAVIRNPKIFSVPCNSFWIAGG